MAISHGPALAAEPEPAIQRVRSLNADLYYDPCAFYQPRLLGTFPKPRGRVLTA
jgi:hypothetical protein